MHSCAYCGDPATQLDHIIPKAHGGPDALWNRAPSCQPCNSSKGSKYLPEWLVTAVLAYPKDRTARIITRLVGGEIEDVVGPVRHEWLGDEEEGIIEPATSLSDAVMDWVYQEVSTAFVIAGRLDRRAYGAFGAAWTSFSEAGRSEAR